MAQTVFAPAQLVRSRIAEGRGDTTAAIQFARIFLNNFDLAPPAQKPLLDEARSRIARLTPRELRRPH